MKKEFETQKWWFSFHENILRIWTLFHDVSNLQSLEGCVHFWVEKVGFTNCSCFLDGLGRFTGFCRVRVSFVVVVLFWFWVSFLHNSSHEFLATFFGLVAKAILLTHWYFSCCKTVLRDQWDITCHGTACLAVKAGGKKVEEVLGVKMKVFGVKLFVFSRNHYVWWAVFY